MEKSLIPWADDVITLNFFLLVNLFIKRATTEIMQSEHVEGDTRWIYFVTAGARVKMKLREAFIHVMDSLFTRRIQKMVARRHSSEVNKAIF